MFLCRMSWYPFGMPLAASVEGLIWTDWADLSSLSEPYFWSSCVSQAVQWRSQCQKPPTCPILVTHRVRGENHWKPGFTLARCGGKKGGEKEQKLFPDSPSDPIPQWSLELRWCGNITRLNPEKYRDRTIAHGPGTLAKRPHPFVYSRPRARIVTSYQSNFKWDMSPVGYTVTTKKMS